MPSQAQGDTRTLPNQNFTESLAADMCYLRLSATRDASNSASNLRDILFDVVAFDADHVGSPDGMGGDVQLTET